MFRDSIRNYRIFVIAIIISLIIEAILGYLLVVLI